MTSQEDLATGLAADAVAGTQEAARGTVLACREAGSGPPLVLVHGLGASHDDWRIVQPLLARRRRTVAVDLRGYGDTPPGPGGYGPEALGRDVLATMDALGIERAALVGHSMGGTVALSLVLAHPGRFSALVLANTLPSFRPRRPREAAELVMRLVGMALLGPRRLAAIMARRTFPHPEQAEQRRDIVERSARNRRSVYLKSVLALSRWSVEHRLRELALPTLVIASGKDYLPAGRVRRMADAIPGAGFTLYPDARHGLPMEDGEAFAARVEAFLNEVSR